MNYHLYLFNSNPPDRTANQAVQSFSPFNQPVAGVTRIFECFVHDLDFCPFRPQDFGVTVFPTLVFAAVTGRSGNDTTVHPHRRLSGSGITRERILANLRQLQRFPPVVQHGGSQGNYDGGGQGDGSFLSLLLPPWLLMASIVATSYKTLSADTVTGKAVYGGLATLGILSWYELPPEKRRFLPGLGNAKTTDTLPIKAGSRVDQYWSRQGIDYLPDYLEGRNPETTIAEVSPVAVAKHFQYHSIEFGNWVTQAERKNALVNIFQSSADLARVLNVSRQKIGMGETLSIAFGARGKGGRATAFYSPRHTLINITKTKGPGAFAHEYGHAIDYHAARKFNLLPSDYAANMWLEGKATKSNLINAFIRVFTVLYGTPDKNGRTPFKKYLSGMPDYWQRPREVWARTFEAWVALEMEATDSYNHWLSFHEYGEPWYPSSDQLEAIREDMAIICFEVVGGIAARPGKAIKQSRPQVQAKAMQKRLSDAIKDVLAGSNYKDLSLRQAGALIRWYGRNLNARLDLSDYREITNDLHFNYLDYDDNDTSLSILSDRGRNFLRAIGGRLQTFQQVAQGADLFPNESGITGHAIGRTRHHRRNATTRNRPTVNILGHGLL